MATRRKTVFKVGACKVTRTREDPETYRSQYGHVTQKLKNGLWTVARMGFEGYLVHSKKAALKAICPTHRT